MKFRDSPLMKRVARWPLSSVWSWFIRYFAFDFVFIVPDVRRTRSAAVRDAQLTAFMPMAVAP